MDRQRAERDLPKYIKKSKKYRLWEIKDVLGSTACDSVLERHRRNRDRIKAGVKKLIKEGNK